MPFGTSGTTRGYGKTEDYVPHENGYGWAGGSGGSGGGSEENPMKKDEIDRLPILPVRVMPVTQTRDTPPPVQKKTTPNVVNTKKVTDNKQVTKTVIPKNSQKTAQQHTDEILSNNQRTATIDHVRVKEELMYETTQTAMTLSKPFTRTQQIPKQTKTPNSHPDQNKNILNSPVKNAKPSSVFGDTSRPPGGSNPHKGTDYPAPVGTPVFATAPGKVVLAGRSESLGNRVIINHGPSKDGEENIYTLYAHGSKILVKAGQNVNTGDEIMKSGNTGKSTGPHVHYEVIVTKHTPSSEQFYYNNKIRHKPDELKDFF
jgi:murein DD-endopeptidase MepM/ murein hydrolase activator NlpD